MEHEDWWSERSRGLFSLELQSCHFLLCARIAFGYLFFTHILELGDEPYRWTKDCRRHGIDIRVGHAHHFTLTQRHPSMTMRNTMCTLPPVRSKSKMKTSSRAMNAASRMRRNVGLRDDPGVRMLEKKPPGASVAASAVGRVVSEVFSMTSGT